MVEFQVTPISATIYNYNLKCNKCETTSKGHTPFYYKMYFKYGTKVILTTYAYDGIHAQRSDDPVTILCENDSEMKHVSV